MNAKHTPGPWTQGTSDVGVTCVWLNGLTEPEDEMGPDHTWIDCGSEANARLIAAAPELLKVLRMARANIAADLQVMVIGRTGPDGLIDDAEVVLLIEAEQDLINQIDEVIAKATGEQA